MNRFAVVSPCGKFRYALRRQWGAGPVLAFVMLNPSTADAFLDDPTVRKCIGFAKMYGFSGIEVLNLFAFRATDPRELARAGFPVGPENDAHLVALARSTAAPIVCAWGAHARGNARAAEVIALLRSHGADLRALALTADGIPRHPLMLGYAASSLAVFE